MKAIELITVGLAGPGRPIDGGAASPFSPALPDVLADALAGTFRVPVRRRSEGLAATFAFDPVRNQYHSTAILQRLDTRPPDPQVRLLGITDLDLYVPVLTFVFGEAQMGGRCALVSVHRLREEFYGLPASQDLLHERLTKEAVHELGHTFGLRHCENWHCVMASTHAVERLDTKGADFCPACRRVVAPGAVAALSL